MNSAEIREALKAGQPLCMRFHADGHSYPIEDMRRRGDPGWWVVLLPNGLHDHIYQSFVYRYKIHTTTVPSNPPASNDNWCDTLDFRMKEATRLVSGCCTARTSLNIGLHTLGRLVREIDRVESVWGAGCAQVIEAKSLLFEILRDE